MLKTTLTLSLTLALGAFVGCGGAQGSTTAESDIVGEGAAYLVTADTEEVDESTSEDTAAAGADDGDLDAIADESTDEMGGDASEAGPEGCDFGAARSRIKAAFDADGDGTLSPAERATLIAELGDRARAPRLTALARHLRHHRFARIRWAFDLNGDRVLDDDERAELVAAMESRCEARKARALERYDANGDGTLDRAELAAARAARREAARARWEAFVAAHDTDGDGVLSREERRAGLREVLTAKRDAIKARFDVDGDGQLSAEEREALKAALRERIAHAGSMTEGA